MSRRVRLLSSIAALTWALVPAIAAEAPPVKPVDAAGWRTLAMTDVDAMHALLRDQTIFPFDTENPAYPRWLEEGHQLARSRAAQVTNAAGYLFTLRAYGLGFRDPHLSVGGEVTASRWPGFVAAELGGKVIVVQSDPSDVAAPVPGTVIEQCDGLTPSELVRQRLSPFLLTTARPARWSIPFLFLDMGNPFAPLPSTCQVRTGGGIAEIALQWRGIPPTLPNFEQSIVDAGSGPPAAWGIAEPAPGVFWIGIPTFAATSNTRPRLEALIAAVRARGEEMRRARAIVIDTRGNAGGTYLHAQRLADAIFTPEVMKPARDAVGARRTAREVRASPENMAIIRMSDVAAFRRGNDSLTTETPAERRREDRAFLERLERAGRSSPPVLRWGNAEASPEGGFAAQRPQDARSPFPARVYFLSSGSCMSACLWFADGVLKVPGVRLIGSETAGDTPYTDVRTEALPSGLARLSFPMKIVRGRGRTSLEAYQPDVRYEGRWDDSSVRSWVMSLIEAEVPPASQ